MKKLIVSARRSKWRRRTGEHSRQLIEPGLAGTTTSFDWHSLDAAAQQPMLDAREVRRHRAAQLI